ncbi:uncharacterized protein B0H18DRAFT_1046642 [Fomitopsis serialis]|uniref:uncharacterized protein n=1 Tax=Fomitopsis serialis TaxID=139415 RepID=UPI002008E301|nr:uncharacterized protein B0H18DRAFT_1046642 [Neoantrodia serialis]KAH9914112.1 hypothetical protein B0H18DRAFT_1046642 [Neoantrodia serialis]
MVAFSLKSSLESIFWYSSTALYVYNQKAQGFSQRNLATSSSRFKASKLVFISKFNASKQLLASHVRDRVRLSSVNGRELSA